MLPDTSLLDLWECDAPSLERGLHALAAWRGERAAAALPLDELNRRLLAMRAEEFGDVLECYAECGQCGAAIEFAVPVAALTSASAAPGDDSVRSGVVTISFRPPTTQDVVAAITAPDPRRNLLERCVVTATSDDAMPVAAADLSDDAMAAVEAALDETHPLLDITLAVDCPECGHAWNELLDVTAYLWADIDMHARRLLEEVAVLAGVYGWAERDVLAMTPQRRAQYLELAP